MTMASAASTVRPEPAASSMLIVADDLSGATDAAAACLSAGLSAATVLDWSGDLPDTDVLAIDANTRRMAADAAGSEVAHLTDFFRASRRILFKKIDSTLRGHVGTETAAMLASLRRNGDDNPTAVLAPAFPQLGRTTIDGRQRLHGVPLEETEVWQREQTGPTASLVERVKTQGLSAALIPIDSVRAGDDAVFAAMRRLSAEVDVIVCDAESEDDLGTICRASRRMEGRIVWIGSAGLAGALARTMAPPRPPVRSQLPKIDAPLLFAVGSPSSTSQRQAARLAAAGVTVFDIDYADLDRTGFLERSAEGLNAALADGQDVLLRTSARPVDASRSAALTAALGGLVVSCIDRAGALFVTGGETARYVLERMQVSALRLVAEIETGVPLSIALGPRGIPVITKAGAFGDDDTMVRCRRAFRDLRPAIPEAVSHEKAGACRFH